MDISTGNNGTLAMSLTNNKDLTIEGNTYVNGRIGIGTTSALQTENLMLEGH